MAIPGIPQDEARPRRTFESLLFVVLVAVVIAYPLVFTLPYYRDLGIKILLYALLAQAWNILAG